MLNIFKRIVLFFCVFYLCTSSIKAQSDLGFNYQAILRDMDGKVIKNSAVEMRFSILDEIGNNVFTENHSVSTSEFGLVNLVIGEGSGNDNLANVNWSNGDMQLSIDVDLDGGGWQNIGTEALRYVPLAAYALNNQQGPQGDQGDTGPVGPKGDKGDAGQQGPTGPKGDTGEKGDPGDIGPIGPIGPKGDQGNTGPQGLTGPKGDKGDKGDIGPVGPKGDQGNTGLQGLTGPKGDKGDKGDIGPVGPKGDQGNTGLQGLTGPKGDKGDKGDIGPVGPKGDQGNTGPQGLTGPKGDKGEKGDPGSYTSGIGISLSGGKITNIGDTNPNDDLRTTTKFGGDVSGTYVDLQIQPAVIGSLELKVNAIGPSNIQDDAVSTSNIVDNAITNSKVAKNNIDRSHFSHSGADKHEVFYFNGTDWALGSVPGGRTILASVQSNGGISYQNSNVDRKLSTSVNGVSKTYTIDISGASFSASNCSVTVTPLGFDRRSSIQFSGGNIQVRTYDNSGKAISSAFSIQIVY